MALEVAIPRLGWAMEKGTFLEWRKRDGDKVKEGDVLFVMEGDKAVQEVEAFGGGVLAIASNAPAPGEEVLVGRVIAHLLAPGEKAPALAAAPAAALAPALAAAPLAAPAAAPASAPVASSALASPQVRPAARSPEAAPTAPAAARGPHPAASPRARRVAREIGVDWRLLQGSGTSGRVTERDVRAAPAASSSRAAGFPSRSRITVEVASSRLSDLAARVSALHGSELPEAALLAGLTVRLCAAAVASLGEAGAGVEVACARADGDAVAFTTVRGAERAPVTSIARSIASAPVRSGPPEPSARLVVVPGELLGLESYVPGSALPSSPLVVVGRARESRISLALHFDETTLGLQAASRLADRLREALEAPELWLAW